MLEMEKGEVQRKIQTNLSPHTYTHTHRFFQQNPWREPMTAGTRAAAKKNLSDYEETTTSFYTAM